MSISIEIMGVAGDKVAVVVEDGAMFSVDPSSRVSFLGQDPSQIETLADGVNLIVYLPDGQVVHLLGFLDLSQGGAPGGIVTDDGEVVASIFELAVSPAAGGQQGGGDTGDGTGSSQAFNERPFTDPNDFGEGAGGPGGLGNAFGAGPAGPPPEDANLILTVAGAGPAGEEERVPLFTASNDVVDLRGPISAFDPAFGPRYAFDGNINRALAGDDTVQLANIGEANNLWDLFLAGDPNVTTPEFFGGAGDDTVTGGNDDDVVIGDEGDDVLDGRQGWDTLIGDSNDKLDGGDVGGNDRLFGRGGDDFLSGDAFDDLEDSAVGGDDTLRGGGGNDLLFGDAGDDLEDSARGGDDLLIGGALNDVIFGDAGEDVEDEAIGGDDTLRGGDGKDVLIGDAGRNLQTTDPGFSGAAGGDDLIRGGDGKDQIFGDAGNDILDGSTGGHDSLFGGEADDIVIGDAGNDLFDATGGNDDIRGGAGNDLLVGDAGDDLGETDGGVALGGVGGDDTIRGGGGNDLIIGDARDDVKDGAIGGDDTLFGGGGNDVVIGDAGNALDGDGTGGHDELFGGRGDDTLFGDAGLDFGINNTPNNGITSGSVAGNDTLEGGRGDDELWGDAPNPELGAILGDDTFVFSVIQNTGDDVIRDFDITDDTLRFDDVLGGDFAGLSALIASVNEAGGDVVITFNDGDTITVDNLAGLATDGTFDTVTDLQDLNLEINA